jgi:hypothetical protein
MAEVKIKKINVEVFRDFIKKLVSIDQFIFIKMDDKSVSSSVYFPQRDAVKKTVSDINDLFELEKDLGLTLKVSFFDGNKVISALNQFSEDFISGKIVYTKIADEYIASDFVLFNKTLKINLFCSDPSLNFMDMTADESKRAFGISESMFKFKLDVDKQSTINSLFKIDKDHDFFYLSTEAEGTENNVILKGDNYQSILTSDVTLLDDSGNSKVQVYKKYMALLDKELYTVNVCPNKIVFQSEETNSVLTIAVCIDEE